MHAKSLRFITLCLFVPMTFLMLTGCVHKSPFVGIEETYFQAMGNPSEFVFTVDMEQGKGMFSESLGNLEGVAAELVDRAQRVSVAMTKDFPQDEESLLALPYPADLSEFSAYGAVEGDYSKFIINTALMYARDFTTRKDGNVTYFTAKDDSISVGMAKNGLLIFSTDDWLDAYASTWKNRELKIPAELSARMEEAIIGIYVADPKTMVNLGFDFPLTVVLQMEEAMFLISEDEAGKPMLDASVRMKNDKLANSLSILIKSQYVAQLRRDGVKFSIADLKPMLVNDGAYFFINRMPLTTEQVASITDSYTSIMQNIGGLV